MIEIKNVSKNYKEIELFNDVNLKLPHGKKILIKGINGCGKSVLLKMILGYSKPDKGHIIVDKKELGDEIDFLPNAGASINSPEFIKEMTGKENLLYLINIRKKVGEKEVVELAQKLKLNSALDKKYKNYSLGMKQKMRIIQALVENPDYLILDEPFDALDKSSQKVVRELLEEYIKNENKTFIFTSHNSEYEEFADIIYEIDDFKLARIK